MQIRIVKNDTGNNDEEIFQQLSSGFFSASGLSFGFYL